MPRLSTAIRRRAYAIHPTVHQLLPSCREIDIAKQDACWLRVLAAQKADGRKDIQSASQTFDLAPRGQRLFKKLCRERARGRPFDYIYGTKPFGGVEIACRPGVLIPRWETEAYTCHLAEKITDACESGGLLSSRSQGKPLRILDLCTGTGCIALLLYHMLWRKFPKLEILGIDVSSEAVRLSKTNLEANLMSGVLGPAGSHGLSFVQHDIFATSFDRTALTRKWDIIISNPPYISPKQFNTVTSSSVRRFEPKLALVPDIERTTPHSSDETPSDAQIGDAFYSRLLEITAKSGAGIALFEVGDMAQAQRVAGEALGMNLWESVTIWRDQPGLENGLSEVVSPQGKKVAVTGHGNARAVVLCRDDGWNRVLS